MDFSPEVWRYIIRGVWFAIVLSTCVVSNLIAHEIGNRRLKKLILKLSLTLGLYFATLVAATILDTYFKFQIAFLTSTANVLFWAWVLYLLWRFFLRLKNENDELISITEGVSVPNPKFINKPKLSVLIDELYLEVQGQIKKTDALERKMQKHLK